MEKPTATNQLDLQLQSQEQTPKGKSSGHRPRAAQIPAAKAKPGRSSAGKSRQRADQLVLAFPAKPRRHRPINPHAQANALALEHRDIAATVAANISRRTGHPREDLEQIAMLGIIQAARRYSPERGPFRPFARTYANGEVYHYLRDKGFLIKVPASWRELYARGQKLIRHGNLPSELPGQLGVTTQRWAAISLACCQRVVPIEIVAGTSQLDVNSA